MHPLQVGGVMKRAFTVALILSALGVAFVVALAATSRKPDLAPRLALLDRSCQGFTDKNEDACTISVVNIGAIAIQRGQLITFYRDSSGREIGSEQAPLRTPFILPGEWTTVQVPNPPGGGELSLSDSVFLVGERSARYPLESSDASPGPRRP